VLAGAMTWFLLKQNDAAGMVTLSGQEEVPGFIRPSQNASQFGLILKQLDGLRPAGAACLGHLLQQAARLVHRRSVILFFSDLLEPSDDVALGFKQLRFDGHEILVFQTLDQDELEFPFGESKIFEDLETGARHVVAPAAARAKYRQRFDAFMEAHYELFRSLEIPHCVVRTDQNPGRALALFLAERRRRY
jgi:uncharacterized protein (DUF58 family)